LYGIDQESDTCLTCLAQSTPHCNFDQGYSTIEGCVRQTIKQPIEKPKKKMKKYKVEVYYDQIEYYIVEAESEEDAVNKVQESDDLEPQNVHDALWEAQSAEEIVSN
jgi:hypothetical protein